MPLLPLIALLAAAQTPIAERSLPADTIVKDTFQAGYGLPVGKIHSLRGETLIFHRDPAVGYRAKTGLPLYRGDILRTQQNSLILCRLVDGSRLAMASGSILELRQSKTESTRQPSVSILNLTQGGVRFYVRGAPNLSTYEFKVQTETAFIVAKEADFIVKAGPGRTEIINLRNSRVEVTDLAAPEEIHFLTDFQRTVVSEDSIEPLIETVSEMDAKILMADFRIAPDSRLFASGVNKPPDPESPNEIPEE